MIIDEPKKGEKCEGCGIRQVGFWGFWFAPSKIRKWHDLFKVEWFYHPKYSRKPYYLVDQEPSTAVWGPEGKKFYRMRDRRYWLCSECFEPALQEEEELRKRAQAEYFENERKFEKEMARRWWANPSEIESLEGPQLEVMKWLKKNEGKKAKIEIYEDCTDEMTRYHKVVECVISSPSYSKIKKAAVFGWEIELYLPDKAIDKIHISENEVEIEARFVTNLPIGPNFKGFNYATRTWTIQLVKE